MRFLIIAFACIFICQSILAQNVIQNNALHFDGLNDYVEMPSNNAFNLYKGTIELWVKPENVANIGCILSNRNGFESNYSIHMSGNQIGLWNSIYYYTLNYTFTNGLWYHIALATTDSASTNVYINGMHIGVLGGAFNFYTGKPFVIGGVKSDTSVIEHFQGTIDEIRLWNYARTQSQINTYKDIQLSGGESGLTALYAFKQGVASGNNSTITNVVGSTTPSVTGVLHNFALTGSSSNFVPGLLTDVVSNQGQPWLLNGNIGTNPTLNAIGTNDTTRLVFRTNGAERMTITKEGLMGIGTTTPDHDFSVVGTTGFSVARLGGGNKVFFEPQNIKDWAIGVWDGAWTGDLTLDARNILMGTRNRKLNVGIGVDTPLAALDVKGRVFVSKQIAIGTRDTLKTGNYALAVNGDAIFNKIKVRLYDSTQGWADYVFKKEYHLPTLSQVNDFISKNGHLPDVPTTAEVSSNGIDIADNQVILLRKVEELTLYLIMQDAEIKKLRKSIGSHQKKYRSQKR